MPQSQPRGIRNHNPGNLRKSADKWQGLAADQTDPDFFVFDSPLYGIRALGVVLLNYQSRYGLDTIRKIINRWAPPSENKTDSYVTAVALACGLEADAPIVVRDQLMGLIRAIIRHENGQKPYSLELIQRAIDMALKGRPA